MSKTLLGSASAYLDAVKHGYTGTRAQFGKDQADFAKNAEQVAADLEASKKVLGSVEEAGNTQKTAIQTAGSAQVEAVQDAGALEVEAVEKAGAAERASLDAAAEAKRAEVEERIEAKGAATLATIPDDYTEVYNRSVRNESRISRNEKRLTNLEQGITPEPYHVDDTVAYSKDVPANALPYAEVNKVGGMTYRVNTGTEEEPVYELRSAPVTEVESVGVNLYSFGDKAIDGFQRFYFEKALPAGTYTVSALVSSTDTDDTITSLVFMAGNESLAYAHMKRDVYNSVKITTTREVTSIRLLSSTSVAKSEGDSSTWQNVMIYKGETSLPYTPYTRNTLPVHEAVQALDGYGWGVNDTVYNYIDWENTQFVKKVGCVDLGTLNWALNIGNQFYAILPTQAKTQYATNHLCAKYKTSARGAYDNAGDKLITLSSSHVWVTDTEHTSSTTLKTAMSGVMLYYELAEPIITDISDLLPDDNYIPVEGGGTVTMLNEYEYAVPSEITYALKEAE